MVEEASISTKLIPAKIWMIFKLKDDDSLYAMIHSCHEESHRLSVITYVWRKEYVEQQTSKQSKFKPYVNIQNIKNMHPIYQIITFESVYGHTLLLPLERNGDQILQIVHPDKWANAFYEFD
jgi:hypothetical protein